MLLQINTETNENLKKITEELVDLQLEVLNDYYYENFIYLIISLLVWVAICLLILRYFNNKGLNRRLDEQTNLLKTILKEYQRVNPKKEVNLDTPSKEDSVNDPDVFNKLLDKLNSDDK